MDSKELWAEFSKTGNIKKYLEYVKAGRGENCIETTKGKIEDSGPRNSAK